MLEPLTGLLYWTMCVSVCSHSTTTDIVSQIQELKSNFGPGRSASDEEGHIEPLSESGREDGLFCPAETPSLAAILRSLPSRTMTDRRLSVYFNAKYAIIRRSISGRDALMSANVSSHCTYISVSKNGKIFVLLRMSSTNHFLVRSLLDRSLQRSGPLDCPAIRNSLYVCSAKSGKWRGSTAAGRYPSATGYLPCGFRSMSGPWQFLQASSSCNRSSVAVYAVQVYEHDGPRW